MADGVPSSDLAQVIAPDVPGGPPEVIVEKGPFKGRMYRRNALGQLCRVHARKTR